MSAWRLCPKCEGEGTTVHPALSVWTAEDRYEDPEGFEDMMAGRYDVTCTRCDGKRVVPDTDEEQENWDERVQETRTRGAESADPDLFYNPALYT
jgi:DnaJ-class molecular chaperone